MPELIVHEGGEWLGLRPLDPPHLGGAGPRFPEVHPTRGTEVHHA
jgi:hypothetical protein